MKKLIIFLLILITSVFMLSRVFFSPERLFKIHVLAERTVTIKNLKHYKDKCAMHGPFVFRFEASGQDVQKIIENNNLIEYKKFPVHLSNLFMHIDSHQLSWWKELKNNKKMKIFGKEDNNDSEPHAKFIFVDNETNVYYFQI